MVATSTNHVVRLTVRVSVASVHRDIDVTLPTSSTLAEVLPELARLIDIPQVHRPWEATTVAGAPLNMHTPLHKLKLFDGSVVALHPVEPPSPPVVRDAAESLTTTAEQAGDVRGLDVIAGVLGAAGVAAMAGAYVSLPAALLLATLALAVLALTVRSRPLYWFVPAFAAAAAGLWVAGPRSEWVDATDAAIGATAAVLTVLVMITVGASLRLVSPAVAAFYITASALMGVGAAGVWLREPLAPAALVVLAGVLTVMGTPGISSRLAGLQIPRIPTAGEEFEASDGYQLDVDERSANAIAIAGAMSCAVALCTIPALLYAGWQGGGWVITFALATAGAVALHSTRHHYPRARVALSLMSLAAVVAVVLAVVRDPSPHPLMLVLAALLILGVGTAPLWSPRLPEIEPTTVVWLERAEAAAIIAVIPLAVHLTGAFAMIRGL